MTNFSATDLTRLKKIHFIGIGGISMSGLAEFMLFKGKIVSGSDFHKSDILHKLSEHGARIFYSHAGENITDDIDAVVYTGAIKADNPEILAAKSKNIPLITRGELVGIIMKQYPTAVGVSGAHGKTTVTSMISQIFLDAGYDPTIMVGGIMPSIDGNLRISNSDTFVTEACEYTNSFLSFAPTTAVILNIAEDHMDFFKDLDDIRHSFRRFAELLPDDGTLVINGEIDNLSYFTDAVNCRVLTFGISDNTDAKFTYGASEITYDEFARPTFKILHEGEFLDTVTLGVPGEHSVYNALAAISVALDKGADIETVKKSLAGFRGTKRRFEIKGSYHGITILDDYAHHPDEITTTLKTVQMYPHNTLWCIFQPHTYTRTRAFLKEFAEALSLADKVILADIYAAREVNTSGISSEDIAELLTSMGKENYYIPSVTGHETSFEAIKNFLKKSCSQGDMIITMGAGDVVNIGEELLNEK